MTLPSPAEQLASRKRLNALIHREEDRAHAHSLCGVLDGLQGVGRSGRPCARDDRASAVREMVAGEEMNFHASSISEGHVRRVGRRARVTVAAVQVLFDQGKSDDEMASALECSVQTIRNKRLANDMLRQKGRRSESKPRKVKQRFAGHVHGERRGRVVRLQPSHPAIADGRTLFRSTVVPVEGLLNVLVSGENSRKIGDRVIKGSWIGFPIFTLTLEERATCPRSCRHWSDCYGNNMHLAKRIRHDAAFEERLGHELAILNSRYPKGFVVRLHVLGDFYSFEYVGLWASFLDRFAALRVFGFSARWNMKDDPIADALVRLVMANQKRFVIRFSDAPIDKFSTVSIKREADAPADAIVCPQQTGRTPNCGSCALCWSTTKRIAFLQH